MATLKDRRLAALADGEAIRGRLDLLTKRRTEALYDTLDRVRCTYGSGGNYARARLDGLPRRPGYDASAAQFVDTFDAEITRIARQHSDGLKAVHAGLAGMYAAERSALDLGGAMDVWKCQGWGDVDPHVVGDGSRPKDRVRELCGKCHAKWFYETVTKPKRAAARAA